MSYFSRGGTMGLLAFFLGSAGIAQARFTSSLPEFRFALHANGAPIDDSMGTMIKPRPMIEKAHRGSVKPRRLRPMSEEKAEWRKLYLRSLRWQVFLDPICRKCDMMPATEGHHPYGQRGAMIMIFAPICSSCHRGIHDHPNESRKQGWLLTK